MRDLNEILLNPVRSRIIQYLSVHQAATAGELASFISDVPRTTLYRHLNILAENDVIIVVAENRVRGSVERTYSLNLTAISKENTKENASRNIFGFLMHIYADFEKYFSNENANLGVDKVFVSNMSLLLSDGEFDELLVQLNALFKKHLNNTPDENRKQRSISFISSPCNEERRRGSENKE